VQFLVGTIEATSQLIGSSDNDLVVVAGTVGGNQIASLAGDDTVVIGGGLLSDDATDTFLQLGDGNDTAYVQEIGVVGASPQSDVYAGAGADHVYFNTFRVEDIFGCLATGRSSRAKEVTTSSPSTAR
jgi:hypothetical protein